jgi:hypothetical protein
MGGRSSAETVKGVRDGAAVSGVVLQPAAAKAVASGQAANNREHETDIMMR